MPYISVRTSKSMEKKQIEQIKSSLGEIIAIIPGKSESLLMVDIQDGCNLYFKGSEEPNAYVKVEVFQKVLPEYAEKVSAAITRLLEDVAQIPMNRTYVTHEGIADWGLGEKHF